MKFHHSDKADQKAVWNEALLEDAVAHAYCIFLDDINKLISTSDSSFQAWPSHGDMEEIGLLQCLTRSVYKCICHDHTLRVIKSENGSVPFNSCMLLDNDFQERGNCRDCNIWF